MSLDIKIMEIPKHNLSHHHFVRISAKDADWLRQRVEEVGGLQLHATREATSDVFGQKIGGSWVFSR